MLLPGSRSRVCYVPTGQSCAPTLQDQTQSSASSASVPGVRWKGMHCEIKCETPHPGTTRAETAV
eukprot:1881622-Rhodomonas_salina.1